MPATPENQPLSGLRVLITRPESQNASLAQKLELRGANVVSQPVIQIVPPSDPEPILDCMKRLDQFGALAFLSRNAASCFAGFFRKTFCDDVPLPPLPPIAAIGSGTAAQLYEEVGLTAKFLPTESNSQSMAEMVILVSKLEDWTKPILVFRAEQGSDVLHNTLAAASIEHKELAVYQSQDVDEADPDVIAALKNGDIDWLTVTSSAIARNAARIFGGCLDKVKVVSISPQTSAAATEAGLTVHAEAKKYNMDGLIGAVIQHRKDNS